MAVWWCLLPSSLGMWTIHLVERQQLVSASISTTAGWKLDVWWPECETSWLLDASSCVWHMFAWLLFHDVSDCTFWRLIILSFCVLPWVQNWSDNLNSLERGVLQSLEQLSHEWVALGWVMSTSVASLFFLMAIPFLKMWQCFYSLSASQFSLPLITYLLDLQCRPQQTWSKACNQQPQHKESLVLGLQFPQVSSRIIWSSS